MNMTSILVRYILCFALLITFFCTEVSPAYAMVTFPPPPPNGTPVRCDSPNCGPQRLSNSTPAIRETLTINFDSVDKNLFVTDLERASSVPKDILQLVKDAASVWESAFEELPELTINVGWANFGILEEIQKESLSGILVGGIQEDCDSTDDVEPPAPTELPSVPSDIIGLHICGPIDELTNIREEPCTDAELKEATILFNSEPLMVRNQRLGGTSPVKLFLDTDPFNSSAFNPLQGFGTPRNRIERSFEFSDPYVVDLFTVALHEVGHALGYSEANGIPAPAHVGTLEKPDVLSPYIPFLTRKCPSRTDVKNIIEANLSVPGFSGYDLVNEDPCGLRSEIPEENSAEPNLSVLKWILVLLALIAVPFGILFRRNKRENKTSEEASE